MNLRTLAVAAALIASTSQAASLEAPLGAALAHPALRGARVGALVVRASDGAVVFARNPDRALVPASNLKILTALAALDRFGPSHRFTTRVLADAPPDADGGVDWLYLEGGGDPTLSSEQWWRLAADLRRTGLRRVRQGLVLDDGAFDGQRWHGDWGRISARAYHAPVGALAANYGAFAVEVRPGVRAGEAARVDVDPPVSYLRIANRARTGAPGSRSQLQVERSTSGAGELVTVSGTLPLGAEPQLFWRSISHPALYAGAVARLQLQALGIGVDGPTRLGPVPSDAQELLAFEGEPLAQVVNRFVKYSNNAIAEMLLKDMGRAATGRPGSWGNGVPAIRTSLEGLGVELDGLVLVDGSGLAHRNRVAPRTLASALLVARDSFRVGPELLAALPIAAADGTLERRAGAAAGVVRAKTGLLDRVTGLSGFASSPSEGELVFSVLVNGYRGSDEAAMAAVDGFAAALVQGGELAQAQEERRAP